MPSARSGHVAAVINGKMLIHGGSNAQAAFGDVWMLDPAVMMWAHVAISAGRPAPVVRWNAASIAVCAVPHTQIFVFGGCGIGGLDGKVSTGDMALLSATSKPEGEFLSDIQIMDTGSGAWTDLAITSTDRGYGVAAATCAVAFTTTSRAQVSSPQPSTSLVPALAAPCARADSALVYDKFNSRLLLIGGWANRPMTDSWSLPVSQMIGPPYAVLSADPCFGPLTGAQPLRLLGLGFAPGATAIARFSSRGATAVDRFVDATGIVSADGTAIDVMTPCADALGSGPVDVRVAFRGSPLTITSTRYTFFAVTTAARCVAFGPALLAATDSAALLPLQPCVPAAFLIQAGDANGGERCTGGDEWHATVTLLPEPSPAVAPSPPSIEAQCTRVHVIDRGDGLYAVGFTPSVPGNYRVDIEFLGTYGGVAGSIRGFPMVLTCATEALEGLGNDVNNEVVTILHTDEASGGIEYALSTHTAATAVWDYVRELVDATACVAAETRSGLLDVRACLAATGRHASTSIDTALTIKRHLLAVANDDSARRLQFDTAHAALGWLSRSGKRERDISVATAKLARAEVDWNEARALAPTVRTAIGPAIKALTAGLRIDLELFDGEVSTFKAASASAAFWRADAGPSEAFAALAAAQSERERFAARVARQDALATAFELDHMLTSAHATMASLAAEADEMQRVWGVARSIDAFLIKTRSTSWVNVEPGSLEEEAKAIFKTLRAGGNKQTRASGAYMAIDSSLRVILTTMPLITALRHTSVRPRHWDALAALLVNSGRPTFTPPHEAPAMLLEALLAVQLHEHTVDVDEIADQAMKEEKMEVTLSALEAGWSKITWITEIAPACVGGAIPPPTLLKLADVDFEMLDSDQLVVQGMLGSRFLATFEADVTAWHRALRAVAEVVAALVVIQRSWAALAPLFLVSVEVRSELPDTATRFEAADAHVRAALLAAFAAPTVKDACTAVGLLASLTHLISELEGCERALAVFLDATRRRFPRFYFVSHSDLLDVLSNGKNPARVMRHLTKVALATESLTLGMDNGDACTPIATAWTSAVGIETVPLVPPVPLEGKAEVYLQAVLDGQKITLKAAMAECIMRHASSSRIEWLMARRIGSDEPADPAQLTLLVAGMAYTSTVDNALDATERGDVHALPTVLRAAEADLAALIRLTQGMLSKADRARVMCLITLDAHGRDIIRKLISEGATTRSAFQWQSQLKQRYVNNEAVLAICDARFTYGFEYLGNGPRLVVTPLTDRIYVTATQALRLRMGCAPAGPAGTGKTETTKDLGSALAVAVYVFNCSPEHDYRSLGNIFKGLAASGTVSAVLEFEAA